MIEDTRPTFEQTYRETVASCSLYELKRQRSSLAPIELVKQVAKDDIQNAEKLIDTLFEDISLLFNRKFVRVRKIVLDDFVNFRVAVSEGMSQAYLNAYLSQFSSAINSCIEKIIPRTATLNPQIGWVKWSGESARIQKNAALSNSQVIKEPEKKSLSSYTDLPDHVNDILCKLSKTHFNYEPYVLTGSNGERMLVIKLGCCWNDIVLLDIDERISQEEILKIDCRTLGFSVGLIFSLTWLIFNSEALVLQFILGILALPFLLLSCVIGTQLYKCNFSKIKV